MHEFIPRKVDLKYHVCLNRLKVDDPVNAVAVHGGGGNSMQFEKDIKAEKRSWCMVATNFYLIPLALPQACKVEMCQPLVSIHINLPSLKVND